MLKKKSILYQCLLATVSHTNGRGPRCTEADQAGIEEPVLSFELDGPLEEEDEMWDTAMVEAVSTVIVTGTLKHVKSSVARSGGIVLRWSSGYGAGGQFLRPGFDPRSRHIF